MNIIWLHRTKLTTAKQDYPHEKNQHFQRISEERGWYNSPKIKEIFRHESCRVCSSTSVSFMPSCTLNLTDLTHNLFLTNPSLLSHVSPTAAVSNIPTLWSLISKDLWIYVSYFSAEPKLLSQQISIPEDILPISLHESVY